MANRNALLGASLGQGIGGGLQSELDQQNKLAQLQRQLNFLGGQDPNALNIFQKAALGVKPPDPLNPADVAQARILNALLPTILASSSGKGAPGSVPPFEPTSIKAGPLTLQNTSPNTPLSGEGAKLFTIATGAFPQISALKQQVLNDETFIAPAIFNTKLRTLKSDLVDRIGRLRSGGAITSDEDERFLISNIPTFRDSKEERLRKLDVLESEFRTLGESISGPQRFQKELGRKESQINKSQFSSVEEAEAANLAPGTEVIIGGRRAIIE